LHRPCRGALARDLEYFRAAGREGPQLLGGEALDLREPVDHLAPADAEAPSQLVAKMRLVDVAGGGRVLVDRRVVEPGPSPERPLGRVGDEDVGVELWVAGARGAVDIARREKAVALDELMPSGAAAGPAGGLLEVVETRPHRLGVGGFDLGGDGMAAERPGQGDRLRRREGQVESRDGATPNMAEAERLPGCRIVPGQHRHQLGGLDLALQAEILGGVADPVALGLPLAGVVVLGAFGDLAEVVVLLTAAELAD
jgi:hypothetical protein